MENEAAATLQSDVAVSHLHSLQGIDNKMLRHMHYDILHGSSLTAASEHVSSWRRYANNRSKMLYLSYLA